MKIIERDGRLLAEDAVDSSDVEPQRVEAALEFDDVVAPQWRRAVIQQSIAEPVPRLHERGPGLAPADPVDAKTAPLLERARRRLGGIAEVARLVLRRVVAGGGEAPLDVTDGCAAIAEPKGEAGV